MLATWCHVCNKPEFQGFLVTLDWRPSKGFLLLLKPKPSSLSVGSAGWHSGLGAFLPSGLQQGGSLLTASLAGGERKVLERMAVPRQPLEVLTQVFSPLGQGIERVLSLSALPGGKGERLGHPILCSSVGRNHRGIQRGSGTFAPGTLHRGEGCENSAEAWTGG